MHCVCAERANQAALWYSLKGTEWNYVRIPLSIHPSERQSLGFLAKLDNSHWGKPVKKFLKHLVPFIYWILADTNFLLHRAPDVFLFCLIQTSLPFFKISVLFLQGDGHLSCSRGSAGAEAASLLQCIFFVPGHVSAVWNWGSCSETFHVSTHPKLADPSMLKDRSGKGELFFLTSLNSVLDWGIHCWAEQGVWWHHILISNSDFRLRGLLPCMCWKRWLS